MDNNQKINQIMEALRMRDEGDFQTNGVRSSTPTIIGADRKTLIAELVKILTVEPVV